MSHGVADSASCLEARLARCRALPEHQRSPEVAAFVLCAELQAQAAAALAARPARSLERRRQEAVLFSLKVAASHCCRPGDSVLVYSQEILRAAYDQLHALLARGAGASNRSLPRKLGAVLEQDRSLATLLTVAAGLPMMKKAHSSSEWLPVVNRMVVQLQQPAEAVRLRQELAAAQAQLPAPLLSYKQLLAFFVGLARHWASGLSDTPGNLPLDVEQAFSAAAKLLPQLVPDHYPSQFHAVMCACYVEGHTVPSFQRALPLVRAVMAAAEQQGADFAVALCGCQLASLAHQCVQCEGPAGMQGACAPSDVLGWVRQARKARRRCDALLPQQWTNQLAFLFNALKEITCWLKQLQQAGDRWQPLDAAAGQAWDEAIQNNIGQALNSLVAGMECSGCGESVPHLKRCAACRLTQYCSSECQHAHWPHHRAACKAEQRRQQERRE